MQDNNYKLIFIPQLGVNDKTLKIVKWYVKNESEIKAGDLICGVESTKTAYEVESEFQGFIYLFYEEGEETDISIPIAVVFQEKADVEKFGKKISEKFKKVKSNDAVITQKALNKAKELNIEISNIKKNGVIKEKDILDFYNSQNTDKADLSSIKIIEGKINVVIYGSGKGAYTIYETLCFDKKYNVICFLDDDALRTGFINNLPIIFGKYFLENFENPGRVYLASGMSRISSKKLIKISKDYKIPIINVIHPNSYISPSVKLGSGNFIKAGAIIDTNTVIEDFCQIDNSVTIAHDCIIESFNHIAPGATLGSSINLGEGCVVGIGAKIASKTKIGKYSVISVGSAVTKDIEEFSIVEGIPAKVIGKRKFKND